LFNKFYILLKVTYNFQHEAQLLQRQRAMRMYEPTAQVYNLTHKSSAQSTPIKFAYPIL